MAIAANTRNKFNVEDGRHFPNTFPEYDAHARSSLLFDDGKVFANSIVLNSILKYRILLFQV